jgi:transposase
MGGYLDGSTDGYAGPIEVLEGRSGRRLRSEAERARIAAESLVPGAKVADIARRHGVTRWQVYDWRKKLTSGKLALAAEMAEEPMFAALVVEPAPAPPPAARNRSGRGETKSCRIELEVDGVILRVRSDIDEAQLTGTIRAIRAASR